MTRPEPGGTHRHGKHSPGRKAGFWLAVPLSGVLVAVVSLNLVFVRYAHREALLAQSAMQRARLAVVRQAVQEARAELDAAADHLATATDAAGAWPLSLLMPVPLLGSPGKAISAGTRAAGEALAAGRILTDYAAEAATDDDLARAASHLAAARQALQGPAGSRLPPVSAAAEALLVQLAETEQWLAGSAG